MKESDGADSVPFEEFIRQFIHISQGQVHSLSSFVGFFFQLLSVEHWRVAVWKNVLRLRRSVAATWLVCFDIRSDIVEERVEVQATGRRFGRGR